jgi:antitoxin VapB
MGLNIKNLEVEQLAEEVARMARETKTEAIRRALQERRARLQIATSQASKGKRVRQYLEREVWPNLPPGVRGRTITKDEEERIVGFGPDGV